MEKREARVYYIPEREGKKAILVFDAGYGGGDVHVYEHKKCCSAKEIEEEIKAYLQTNKLSKEAKGSIVSIWVEKNFGHSMSWKLTPE